MAPCGARGTDARGDRPAIYGQGEAGVARRRRAGTARLVRRAPAPRRGRTAPPVRAAIAACPLGWTAAMRRLVGGAVVGRPDRRAAGRRRQARGVRGARGTPAAAAANR